MNRIPGGRVIALLALLTSAGGSGACAFIFTDTVPTDAQKLPYFDCTSTYGLAVADGLFAASGAIGAGTTFAQSKQDYADKNNGASRNVAAGADLVLAGITAVSAIYGVVQSTRCDRAKEELKARLFAAPLRPPPLNLVPRPEPPPPPARGSPGRGEWRAPVPPRRS